jgi:hypothetical protein
MIIRYLEDRYPEPKNYDGSELYIKANKNDIKLYNIKLGTNEIQLSSYNTYYVCVLNENIHTYTPTEDTFTNNISDNKKIFVISKQELLDKFNVRTFNDLSSILKTFNEKLQIDTGVIDQENNIYEVVITLYDNLETFYIKTSDEVEYQTYSKSDEPRFKLLYPSYALNINNNTYKCTKNAEWLSENNNIEYYTNIEIEIQKYNRMDFEYPLNRIYDNEQLYVMTSIGQLDNDIVKLENGKAKVTLHLPENYKGEVTLSVGRSKNLHRNTYNLNIV